MTHPQPRPDTTTPRNLSGIWTNEEWRPKAGDRTAPTVGDPRAGATCALTTHPPAIQPRAPARAPSPRAGHPPAGGSPFRPPHTLFVDGTSGSPALGLIASAHFVLFCKKRVVAQFASEPLSKNVFIPHHLFRAFPSPQATRIFYFKVFRELHWTRPYTTRYHSVLKLTVHAKIDQEVHDALLDLAKKKERTLSWIIAHVLRLFVATDTTPCVAQETR